MLRDIRNIFIIEKENKAIIDIMLRDIRNHFENEEEDHYKLVRISNFWSSNYVKYKSKSDKNKTL